MSIVACIVYIPAQCYNANVSMIAYLFCRGSALVAYLVDSLLLSQTFSQVKLLGLCEPTVRTAVVAQRRERPYRNVDSANGGRWFESFRQHFVRCILTNRQKQY